VCRRHEPARLDLLRDLRGYGLRRLLVHQFRVVATRALFSGVCGQAKVSAGGTGCRRLCRPFRPRSMGLAAAKHYQQLHERAVILAEVRTAGRFAPPPRPREYVLQCRPSRLRPGRSGPMSLEEMICWHLANGTLTAFLASLEMG
jgi:hypothetical protein